MGVTLKGRSLKNITNKFYEIPTLYNDKQNYNSYYYIT